MQDDSRQFDDLQRRLNEQAAMQEKAAQQLAMVESLAKQKMSREAIARYGTVKMAHPETAIKAITAIAQAVQRGQIKEQIGDEEFKAILNNVKQGKTQFTFKNLGK